MEHVIEQIAEQVRAAGAARRTLRPVGGGTKDFYGERLEGEPLAMRQLSGIVDYEPSELFVTVRAGTPLAELESALRGKQQSLAFEPPHFGASATVGGCIASGLSGPTRMRVGPLRDFILGVKVVDGRGDVLTFGGQVMKNVAGYDVSRLMAGSLGTLAVLLEVSIKVLPRPIASATLAFDLDEATATRRVNEWICRAFPVASTAWHDGRLCLRLAGAAAAVDAARVKLGGELLADEGASTFWEGMREQTDPFFSGETPLWRLAVPATTEPLALQGDQLIEWNGAQRWWRTELAAQVIRAAARASAGHATLFRSTNHSTARHSTAQDVAPVFSPLDAVQMKLHRNLKQAFDPYNIFSPGRMYSDL